MSHALHNTMADRDLGGYQPDIVYLESDTADSLLGIAELAPFRKPIQVHSEELSHRNCEFAFNVKDGVAYAPLRANSGKLPLAR
jgi:hypothetical protein